MKFKIDILTADDKVTRYRRMLTLYSLGVTPIYFTNARLNVRILPKPLCSAASVALILLWRKSEAALFTLNVFI